MCLFHCVDICGDNVIVGKTVGPFLCIKAVCSVTSGCDSATLWTVALQAPLSMEFAWQEYWNRLPRPPPGDLPDRGVEPMSPALQADSLLLRQQGSPQWH